MRFTDRKGIKIYCCVSFSPCKVWIKCHTLACELLNELVCSLWCEPCKYPSWLWNGGLLSPGGWRLEAGGGGRRWGALTRIGGHIGVRQRRQLGRQRGTGAPNGSIDWLRAADAPHLKWQVVTDGKAPRWLRCLVILGEETIDRHPPRPTSHPSRMRWLTCTVRHNLLAGKFRSEWKEVFVHAYVDGVQLWLTDPSWFLRTKFGAYLGSGCPLIMSDGSSLCDAKLTFCAHGSVDASNPANRIFCPPPPRGTLTLFVLKCEAAYLLTQFPLSEGLVSVKHIKIIMQSLANPGAKLLFYYTHWITASPPVYQSNIS